MTTTQTDTRRDRHGFPLVTCSRCGGTGLMPFSYKAGTCFKCIGSGWVHATKATSAIADEYTKALRASARTTAEEVQPGDVIEATYLQKDWKTVASVEVTDRQIGETRLGTPGTDTYRVVRHYARLVTFTDGTSREFWSQEIRRQGGVDPAPYLARLPKKWRP